MLLNEYGIIDGDELRELLISIELESEYYYLCTPENDGYTTLVSIDKLKEILDSEYDEDLEKLIYECEKSEKKMFILMFR